MKKFIVTISMLLFAFISIYSQTAKDAQKKPKKNTITIAGNRLYQNNGWYKNSSRMRNSNFSIYSEVKKGYNP